MALEIFYFSNEGRVAHLMATTSTVRSFVVILALALILQHVCIERCDSVGSCLQV